MLRSGFVGGGSTGSAVIEGLVSMKFADLVTADPDNAIAEADDVAAMRSILGRINGFLYRCRCDAGYTMIFMTEAIGHLTGYPASDFIGNRVRSFVSITRLDDQKRIFERSMPPFCRANSGISINA